MKSKGANPRRGIAWSRALNAEAQEEAATRQARPRGRVFSGLCRGVGDRRLEDPQREIPVFSLLVGTQMPGTLRRVDDLEFEVAAKVFERHPPVPQLGDYLGPEVAGEGQPV